MSRATLVLFSLLLANPAAASLKEGTLPSFVPNFLEDSSVRFDIEEIREFRRNLRGTRHQAELAPKQESRDTERQSQEQ